MARAECFSGCLLFVCCHFASMLILWLRAVFCLRVRGLGHGGAARVCVSGRLRVCVIACR